MRSCYRYIRSSSNTKVTLITFATIIITVFSATIITGRVENVSIHVLLSIKMATQYLNYLIIDVNIRMFL
jgi:hypothetical protein